MRTKKYERIVSMQCPTCGGNEFEREDENQGDEELIKCIGCDLEITLQALRDTNAKNIQAHVDEVGKEVVSDLQKEFHTSIKKIFKNNKFFKIK
jgi:hypothetical protein